MKRKIKYVYRCIKGQIEVDQFGLSHKWYKIGDYITYDGMPTKDLQKAYIYGDDEDDYDADTLSEMTGRDHFQKLEIEIKFK